MKDKSKKPQRILVNRDNDPANMDEQEQIWDSLEHLQFVGRLYARLAEDETHAGKRQMMQDMAWNIAEGLRGLKFIHIEGN